MYMLVLLYPILRDQGAATHVDGMMPYFQAKVQLSFLAIFNNSSCFPLCCFSLNIL